jgi:hypothetical protein
MISEIKNEFHHLIDSLENEELLETFYETMNDHKDELAKPDILDELTDEQKIRLNKSLAQIKSGNTISHDEALKRIEQWRTK